MRILEVPETETSFCQEKTIRIVQDPETDLQDCPERVNDETSTEGIYRDNSGEGGKNGPLRAEQEEQEFEEENPLQDLIAPLVTVFQLVIRSSYIATNIVMMVSFSIIITNHIE